MKVETLAKFEIPLLSDIPVIGPILFKHDPMVYVSILLIAATWYVLTHTRAGLILRGVGENHDAAHALGYKVIRVRLMAIAFGGACAGMGGAYISLVRVPQWVDGMTAGAGWIALAIVVFASWRPWRVLLGAYLFGGDHGPAAEPAGRGCSCAGRGARQFALRNHHHGSGGDFDEGQPRCTGGAWQDLPRDALRRIKGP